MKMWKIWICVVLCFYSCKKSENPLFEILESEQTGIEFSNDLEVSLDVNIFNYLYFYNGGGVGSGDFNNDGLIDLFFTANQKDNQLYLNQGGLKFKDISKEAGIINDGGWSTGVSIVDINNDGMLDIYVSQVGKLLNINGANQLFVCTGISSYGIPKYEEKAKEYGLQYTGLCTQAVFFDYDLDGDLDMFQLNHSTHKNNTFGQRQSFTNTVHELSGDRMYQNQNGVYVEVSDKCGIYRSSIGYGLGVVASDINMDGLPDLYIGNDFHENDYYYINNGDGTFTDKLPEQMMHTSRFSMGVDAGDVNNDGLPDVISLDMLPEDPFILKKSEGEDALDIFNFKLGYGYNYQYAKNALQINNGNGSFSEVAMFSGIHATDWSWASIFADFNNDGRKDIFVSNGIPKRMNDIDYINFMTQSEVQWKIKTANMEAKDLELITKLPEIKLLNKIYTNEGDLNFQDAQNHILNDKVSYSNGTIIADLDNDGDLDIVTNNINEKAFLYENKTCSSGKCLSQSIKVKLKGNSLNVNALGSKILIFSKDDTQLYEKYPVKGFISSMESAMIIAKPDKVDSILLIWPDNSFEKLNFNNENEYTFEYKSNLPKFNYANYNSRTNILVDLQDKTIESNIGFIHQENPFIEFNREILIPHAVSNEGPAIAIGDINGDGLEDVFFGNAKWKEAQVWIQGKTGKFTKTSQPSIEQDSTYEDVDAKFVDVNNDGFLDLIVGSGGNEYSNDSEYLLNRIYRNDGKGNFTRDLSALKGIYMTTSCILTHDFNGDGFVDLFIGGRAMPWKYGEIPNSYFLQNDGKGNFKDVTESIYPAGHKIGLISDGQWADMNGDGQKDLVLSIEWDKITVLLSRNGKFEKMTVGEETGLWNFVEIMDLDKDGDMDIVAGNLGLNSRLKASIKQPIRMYYSDFDKNDTKEQILTYFVKGKEIPFANMMELQKQLPILKKRFLKAEGFAKADIYGIFTKEELSNSQVFSCNYLSNCVFINDGNMKFSIRPLPTKAQLSSFKAAVQVDINGDRLPDLFLGGNFYENNVQMGRYDADYGCFLVNKGKGEFEYAQHTGLQIKGQIRNISPIKVNGEEQLIIGRNNDEALLVKVSKN